MIIIRFTGGVTQTFYTPCSVISSDLHVAHVYHLSYLNWIPRSFFSSSSDKHWHVVHVLALALQSDDKVATKTTITTTKKTNTWAENKHALFAMMHSFCYEDTMIDMWHPRLRIYIYYVCLSCQRIASCNCARRVCMFFSLFFCCIFFFFGCYRSSVHFTSALSARAETRWFMVAKVAIQ